MVDFKAVTMVGDAEIKPTFQELLIPKPKNNSSNKLPNNISECVTHYPFEWVLITFLKELLFILLPSLL